MTDNYRLTLPEMTVEGPDPDGVAALLRAAVQAGMGRPQVPDLLGQMSPDVAAPCAEKAEADPLGEFATWVINYASTEDEEVVLRLVGQYRKARRV